jgi:hypothetical protein
MITTDRFISAVRALVRELFPALDYQGFFAYSVAAFDDASQTADLRPLNSGSGLPDLQKISVRAPASKVKLIPGGTVLVGFEDRDPSRPFVAFFDRATAYATALPAARQGDLTQTVLTVVQATIQGVPVPNTYWIVIPPSAASPTFVPGVGGTVPYYGVISTGSATLKTQS